MSALAPAAISGMPGLNVAVQEARLRALLAGYGFLGEDADQKLVTPRCASFARFGRPHAVLGFASCRGIHIHWIEPDGAVQREWADNSFFQAWTNEAAPAAPRIPRCTTEGSVAMRDALVATVLSGAVTLARYDLCRDHLRRAGHDVRTKAFDEAFAAAVALIEARARRAPALAGAEQ